MAINNRISKDCFNAYLASGRLVVSGRHPLGLLPFIQAGSPVRDRIRHVQVVGVLHLLVGCQHSLLLDVPPSAQWRGFGCLEQMLRYSFSLRADVGKLVAIEVDRQGERRHH